MFVRSFNPVWYFRDLTGLPLNAGYYASFLTNTLPYIPQAVFQDPAGTIPWNNPIQFLADGSLPDNLYFPDSAVYRIEIRQGNASLPSNADPLIKEINNYVVGQEEAGGGDTIFEDTNLITNPQFADIYFASPFTFTQGSSGTYTIHIGPGWDLVLTGTGTTILTQATNSGSTNTAGNPPYFLIINNSGWSTAKLVQTFANNGALFANGALSLSFEAVATTNAQTITVAYTPSKLNNSQTFFNASINTGNLTSYYAALSPINTSNNTDVGQSATTQIVFGLPGSGTLSFTNVQLLGQSVPFSSSFVTPSADGLTRGSVPLFQEESYERIVDHEFHVYKNSLVLQPKDSILTGWQFALNPWQFNLKTVNTLSGNAYTADQTIIVQQAYVANVANANNVNYSQATAANGFGLDVVSVTAHNNFAIIQLIDTATCQPYFNNILSSLVTAKLKVANSVPLQFKMRLIYATTVPATAIGQTYPIASWVEGADPVFDAAYTAIAPINDPVYTLSTLFQQFPFNGFQLPAASTGTMLLGICLYTVSNLDISPSNEVIIENVSLVPNSFAIDCNSKTFDATLRECQFYFEKSYENAAPLADPTTIKGQIQLNQDVKFNSSNWVGYVSPWAFQFNTIKRASPTMIFYSPTDGTGDRVDLSLYKNGVLDSGSTPASPDEIAISTNYTLNISTKDVTAVPKTTTIITSSSTSIGDNVSAIIQFHYSANARIGG